MSTVRSVQSKARTFFEKTAAGLTVFFGFFALLFMTSSRTPRSSDSQPVFDPSEGGLINIAYADFPPSCFSCTSDSAVSADSASCLPADSGVDSGDAGNDCGGSGADSG